MVCVLVGWVRTGHAGIKQFLRYDIMPSWMPSCLATDKGMAKTYCSMTRFALQIGKAHRHTHIHSISRNQGSRIQLSLSNKSDLSLPCFHALRYTPLQVSDVHSVMSSFKKLMRACNPSSFKPSPSTFLSDVEQSGWLTSLTTLLQLANAVADLISIQSSSVLVALEKGMDATAQVRQGRAFCVHVEAFCIHTYYVRIYEFMYVRMYIFTL